MVAMQPSTKGSLLGKGIQTPMAQGRSTQIISTIKWIRTSRLSIKNPLSLWAGFDAAHDPRTGGEDERPLSGSKSSFATALICVTRGRMPASASTNHGPGIGDLMRSGVQPIRPYGHTHTHCAYRRACGSTCSPRSMQRLRLVTCCGS